MRTVRPNVLMKMESRPRGAPRGGFASLQSIAWKLVVTIALVGLAAGGYKLSQVAQARVQQQERFRVPIGAVRCSSPPEWVRGDLIAEVTSRSGLSDPLNTLDPQLAERIRDAFASHPWVRDRKSVV